MGKDSIFKGLATGSLTTLQCIYGQHKLDLVCFFFLLLVRGGHKSGMVGLEGLRNECDWDALYEIAK